MVKYLVVIEQTDTGVSAYVPDLPGCVATGKTKKEVEQLIYEAIQMHLESLRDDQQEIPPGRTESEVFVFA